MQKPVPPTDGPVVPYAIENPQALAENMLRLFEEGGKIWSEYIERSNGQLATSASTTDVGRATATWSEVAQAWALDPQKMAEAQSALMVSYVEVWNNAMQRMLGVEVAPVANPDAGDNRFKDPEWSTNPYFDFWKQSYLVTAQWAEKVLADTDGIDERTRAKAEFYLRQMSSALSPSNFPITNPEVLRETFKSNAGNLVEGMSHLATDLGRSSDVLRITQTDITAFEVGRNLATTPGKVVFQNDVFQLIQYTPTTETVFVRPFLIVPPWINKFYILDLTAQKSFVRYLVDKGFTVFLVSWVNPDARHADKSFEDYMKEGVLTAADAVLRECGKTSINVLGYCVGGTMLATTLAYAAARGVNVFESATFLTTQTDFSKAGDLSIFIDEQQLAALKEMMKERGYLDGARMASVFNMLRPRDLLWPYIVNNYLLGKKPMPFDLLFWNQDSTRMPMANHIFYLNNFYKDNKLSTGELVIGGQRLDLSKIKMPIFHLAAKEDHIAPARSCYTSARQFGGPVEYVLAGSGHIAGVINPPDKIKYQYWTNSKLQPTYDEWFAGAKETPGSWWPHWIKWLESQSGDRVAARQPGSKLGTIENAPGSFVRVKA